MSTPRRPEAGFSNIIATLIGSVLVFTIVLPLNIYLQDLRTLYDRAVEERTVFDDIRLREDMDLDAYEIFNQAASNYRHIMLRVYNPSDIALTIQRIMIVAVSPSGQPTIVPVNGPNSNPALPILVMPRGPTLEIDSGFVAQAGVTYYMKVATARGNMFLPAQTALVGGQGVSNSQSQTYAYALAITISGMKPGKAYTFSILGNVPYSPYTLVWKATAFNKDQSLAFGVNPGEYVLSLNTTDWSKVLTIKVPETLGVVFQVDDNAPAGAFKTQLDAPKKVKKNNVFEVDVTVTNELGFSLSNVVVTLSLDSCSGWTITDDGATSSKNIGTLDDGDSLKVTWQIEPGNADCTVSSSATGTSGSSTYASTNDSETVSPK